MKKNKGGLVFFYTIEDNVFQNKKICNNNTILAVYNNVCTNKKKPKKMCVLNICVNMYIYIHTNACMCNVYY